MEELVAVIKGDIKDFKAKMDEVSGKLHNVQQKFQQIGASASKYITLPVLAAGTASFKMASDYQESLNKVDVAFKSSADEVKKWSETTLKAFGIASGTALDMAALYGDMATSMGFNAKQAAKMSMELVGLAGDMASFKNISIDVANTALKSIFTGETESLKTLGIVMTEANIKAWMLSEGIKGNYEKMDQAQKVAIRYNYVLAQTANSQGDFARTGGGAANQMRIMMESLKELGVTFGQVLLPAVTEIIKKINKWLESLRNLSPETKKLIVVIAALAAALGPASLALSGILKIIPLIAAGGKMIAANWFPIIAVLTAVAGGFMLVSKWQKIAQQDIDATAKSAANMLPLVELERRYNDAWKEYLDISAQTNALEKKRYDLGIRKGAYAEARFRYESLKQAIELSKEASSQQEEFNKDLEVTKVKMDGLNLGDFKMPSLDDGGKSTIDREDAPMVLKPIELKGDEFADGLKVQAEALRNLRSEFTETEIVYEDFGNLVESKFTQVTSSIKGVIAAGKEFTINMNAIFEGLAEDTIASFATEVGTVLGGGDFGLDNILNMFADWAIKLGSILIAAGISIDSFKKSILSNPLGVAALGAALVVAGAAVKAAVQTNPTSSAGASSGSGGGNDNWDAYGERNLRGKIEVQVNGVLKGNGRDLYGVITKENARRSL